MMDEMTAPLPDIVPLAEELMTTSPPAHAPAAMPDRRRRRWGPCRLTLEPYTKHMADFTAAGDPARF